MNHFDTERLLHSLAFIDQNFLSRSRLLDGSRRVLRGVVSFQLRRQTNGAKQEANFLSLNEQGQKASENIIFISSNWKIKETSENKTLIFLFEISPGLVLLCC